MQKEEEKRLGEYLFTVGVELNVHIANQQRGLLEQFKEADLFLTSIVLSLTWTGHAIGKPDYYKEAIDFLTTGREEPLSKVAGFAGRCGKDNLMRALQGWRVLLERIHPHNVDSISAQDLVYLQDQCRSVAVELHRAHSVAGIGGWLLYAPFKIIASYRRDIWTDAKIDELRMPLGFQVEKGVRKLFKLSAEWISGFDIALFSETEGGLTGEELAKAEFVHGICKNIIADKNIQCTQESRRIIHANSGLYKFGEEEGGAV